MYHVNLCGLLHTHGGPAWLPRQYPAEPVDEQALAHAYFHIISYHMIYIYIYICIDILHIHICVYVYVYMCICIYVYLYIYIYIYMPELPTTQTFTVPSSFGIQAGLG